MTRVNAPLVVLLGLLVCAFAVMIPIPIIASGSVTTLASTELINFYSMSSGEITTWIGLLDAQNISIFICRLNAMYEWQSSSSTGINKIKQIIPVANSHDIAVSVDLHTWYTTWDSYFRDSASNHASNRATYIDYVEDTLNAFDGYNIHSFQVLNEPQARTASSSENQFILDVISAAHSATDKPVSVRFMGGYSPTTGHYSSSIDAACDYLCRNTYWDARYPTQEKYGCSEQDLLNARNYAHNHGKEAWITEFGYSKTNQETQRQYVEAFVEWGTDNDFDKLFCWVSQPDQSGETYNIFTGYNPHPAFYELVSETSSEPPPLPPNDVALNAPNNLQVVEAYTVNFNYTPTFYQGSIYNASLWANVSGSWQRLGWNTTTVTNNSLNTMSYTFSSEATYLWNIQTFNATTSHWATANRTVVVNIPVDIYEGLQDCLVLWLRFEEGDGTTTEDYSDYDNSGTLLNGTSWVDGKFGGGVSFDGINDYVKISSESVCPSIVSVSVWFKLDAKDKYAQYLVSNDRDMSPPSGGYNLHIDNNNKLRGTIWRNSTSTTLQAVGSTSLDTNIWYHAVMTFDGTQVKLYLDGEFDGQSSLISSDTIETAPYDCHVGVLAHEAPTYYQLEGTIDEVRIYSRVLTAEDVEGLYTSTDFAPFYGDYGVSTTKTGKPATFSCYWQDETMLHYGILSYNLNDDAWTNRSAISLYAPYQTFEDTFTLPSVDGVKVTYRFYANDTAGQWMKTPVVSFTTLTVTWTVSGNWTVANAWQVGGNTFVVDTLTTLSLLFARTLTYFTTHYRAATMLTLTWLLTIAQVFMPYVPFVPTPLELPSWLQFLYEGDFFGFVQGVYVSAFQSVDLLYGAIALLFTVPLYIRTKSLLFMSIAWILFGGLFLVAMPMVSGVAILLVGFGLAGMFYKLYTSVRG